MKKLEIAENLLNWADELEDLNIKGLFLDEKRVSFLVKELHIASGMLIAARAALLAHEETL